MVVKKNLTKRKGTNTNPVTSQYSNIQSRNNGNPDSLKKHDISDIYLDVSVSLSKSGLKSVFEEVLSLGFSEITYQHDLITLGSQVDFKYTIKLNKKSLMLDAKIDDKSQELKLLLMLIRLASVISDYGTIRMNPILRQIDVFLTDISDLMDTSYLSLSAKYKNLYNKNNLLEKKYDDLVASSEQNARILLECERRHGEVESKLTKMNKLTDKQLMVEVFKWIKIHNGKISFDVFSSIHNVPQSKIENVIGLLIKEGYIEKE